MDTGEELHTLEVSARAFAVCAGAIESPLLFNRSDAPDPERNIGARLHVHPGAAVAGVFDREIFMWQGVPQSYECTEFLSFKESDDKRAWILPASAHPAGVSSMLPETGREHAGLIRSYPNLSALSVMLHDKTTGSVRGTDYPDIHYSLTRDDRMQMMRGLKECGRLLFAAGAREVWLPFARLLRVQIETGLVKLPATFADFDPDLVGIHPMSTLWMGNSPQDSCTDSRGRFHHLDNIFVADTSLFPTSIGVPPQITTYAMGLYVADSIAEYL